MTRIDHRRSTTFSDYQPDFHTRNTYRYCCFSRMQTKNGLLLIIPLEIFLWVAGLSGFLYLKLSGTFDDLCEYAMQEAANFIDCHKVTLILSALFAIRGLAFLLLFFSIKKQSSNGLLLVLTDLTLRLGLQMAICVLLTIAIVCRREWLHKRPYLERLIVLWLLTCKDLGVFCLFVAYYKFVSEWREWRDNEIDALIEVDTLRDREGLLKRMEKVRSMDQGLDGKWPKLVTFQDGTQDGKMGMEEARSGEENEEELHGDAEAKEMEMGDVEEEGDGKDENSRGEMVG